MDRPDFNLKQEIHLDRNSSIPLYQQLVDGIAKCIQLGVLKNGFKLPSTRVLAKELNLNRNTILKSIAQLESEGWIKVYHKRGCIIQFQEISLKSLINKSSDFATQSNFQIIKSNLISWPKETHEFEVNIHEGEHDQRLIDLKIGAMFYASCLQENKRKFDGEETKMFFMKRFVNFLNITKNLNVKPDEVMITKSPEICLQLICKVLMKKNDKIAICDLSDYKDNMLFQSNDIRLELVSSDSDGLIVDDLKRNYSNSLKGIFLQSYHQIPTAVMLSKQRKLELIEFVQKKKIFIIDSIRNEEYTYAHQPNSGFRDMLHHGQIILIGDIGKEMGPGFQHGFLLGPRDLIEELKMHHTLFESNHDPYLLRALAKGIEGGELLKLIQRHKRAYKERRELMVNLLLQYFGEEIQTNVPKAGFGLWVKFRKSINLMELKKCAEYKGLGIPFTCMHQTKDISALRIGFAQLEGQEIEKLVKLLFNAYVEVTG